MKQAHNRRCRCLRNIQITFLACEWAIADGAD
jgi:hypothetical protein